MACGCVDRVGRSYSVSSMKCRPLTHEIPGLMIIMYHETWPLLIIGNLLQNQRENASQPR